MAAIEVNTLTDLERIGTDVEYPVSSGDYWTMNADYVLTGNIVINGTTWVSIGNNSKYFNGTFDGNSSNGHTITFGDENSREIMFESPTSATSDGYGLFGNVKEGSAKIENLIVHVQANLSSDDENYAGVLVGFLNNSSIENCHVIFSDSYSITGGNYTGGMIGTFTGTQGSIEQCTVQNGHVKGIRYVGGVVGQSVRPITQSSSSAAVTGSQIYVGGLVGYCTADISECYATGNVFAAATGGGLVGRTGGSSFEITKSYATGNVRVTYDPTYGPALTTGGLIGNINTPDLLLSQCYSTGEVRGDGRNVGGLIGSISTNVTIQDCYSTSSVYSFHVNDGLLTLSNQLGRNSGGLIGNIPPNDALYVQLERCYAAGSMIYAENNSASGLVGSINSISLGVEYSSYNLLIEDCYSLVGTVSSSDRIGRIFGEVFPSNLGKTLDETLTNGNIDLRIFTWNGIKGNFNSNETDIPNVISGAEFNSVSKADVYKNATGWSSFGIGGPIWEMSTTNYGLPVFVWQTEEPTMIPMNESRSGGSGTGSAVISNNNSTQIVQPSTPEPTIESTPTPQPTPTPEVLKPESQTTTQPVESKTSIWWYIIVIVLAIAIVASIVYFVKFKK